MKGILMLEILYHRTVSGHKTQTRRSGGLQEVNENPDDWKILITSMTICPSEGNREKFNRLVMVNGQGDKFHCVPRYKVDEIVCIKEPTFTYPDESILYAYDLPADSPTRKSIKFANKLFMHSKKARRYVQITGLKCERLLDISDEDCIKEGILKCNGKNWQGWMNYDVKPLNRTCKTAKESFFSLFRLANKVKKNAPLENPWVFVYSYKLVDRPV